jgi:His-Xaa-Ser system radical SAM maturase HxsC
VLSLEVQIETEIVCPSFVLKLEPRPGEVTDEQRRYYPDKIIKRDDGHYECMIDGMALVVKGPENDEIDGDILLVNPQKQRAQRLIRRNSHHNTILFTERCDQLCAMCSQPPKDRDYSPLFRHYRDAILLADNGVRIGISGGEPTLYIEELLTILEAAAEKRPDLRFHILTNCQHFETQYSGRLENLHQSLEILWGVPLYSHEPSVHEEIVGKVGAFEKLMEGFYRLGSSGGRVELRTVLTARNALDLPRLSKFISTNLPFISFWAIMAMEPIGFAKANKNELFFDHSIFPEPLIAAVQNAATLGVAVQLYNFPLCTVPRGIRQNCVVSISDWKRKFVETCNGCELKSNCTGFFEWYTESWQWEYVRPLNREGGDLMTEG